MQILLLILITAITSGVAAYFITTRIILKKRTWPVPQQNPMLNIMEYSEYLRLQNQTLYRELPYLKECFNALPPEKRNDIQSLVTNIYSDYQKVDHYYDKIIEYVLNSHPDRKDDNIAPSVPFTALRGKNPGYMEPNEPPRFSTHPKQENNTKPIHLRKNKPMDYTRYNNHYLSLGNPANATLEQYAEYLGIKNNPELQGISEQYANAISIIRNQRPNDPETLNNSVQ